MPESGNSGTFAKLLNEQVARRGTSPSIRAKRRGIWETMTWAELAADANALAAGLVGEGFQRGGCIAVLGDYTLHLHTAVCAAHAVGAVVLPLFPFATPEELAEPLRSARVRVVFAENQEQVDKLLEIAETLPDLARIVFDADRGMHHYGQSQLIGYDAFIEAGRRRLQSDAQTVESRRAEVSPDDPAFMFLSPGASGGQRLVRHTHRSLLDRARSAVAADSLSSSDVTMAYLPPGWIAQMQVAYTQALVAGYCVCCPESMETTLGDIREIAPTYFLATPRVLEAIHASITHRIEAAGGFNLTLFRSGMAAARRVEEAAVAKKWAPVGASLAKTVYGPLLYAPLRDALGLSRIRAAYVAGDLVEPSLMLFLRALGVNLKQLYGTTDTGYFVTMHRDGAVDPGTLGQAADGIELRVAEDGEILVRAATLSGTAHREGFVGTGDLGRLNPQGQLELIDRKKDVGRLADGTVLAPRQVETRLKTIPFIKEAVVVGDGKAFVAALIDIDTEATSRFADAREASYTGRAELAALDVVYDAIAQAIAQVNAELAKDERLAPCQIGRFAILQAELAPHTGMLTRIGTLRRGLIEKAYADLIAAFYDGRTSVALAEASEIEGHQDEVVRHQLMIRDVRVSARQTRTAA